MIQKSHSKNMTLDAILQAGWTLENNALHRLFLFKDFKSALGFMNAAARYCEEADHHPEWTNVYNRLDVRLTTHDHGGVTQKDLDMARHFDALFAERAQA